MTDNPFIADEEQFEYFIEAMSAAFEDIDIPEGVIDGENIMDGSIRPEKVALGANWDFRGRVSASNLRATLSRSNSGGGGGQSTLTIYDDHVLGTATIVLVDASKKIITVTLPPAASQKNREYTIKRIDDNSNSNVLLTTVEDDKLDLQTLITIPERGSLICVSSGTGWHILANYS